MEFRGAGFLKARTQACRDAGFQEHSFVEFRYRPANVGDNADEGQLSIFFGTFATNHIVDGGLASSLKKYTGASISSNFNRFVGRMKKRRQNPATVTPTTDFVTLVGVIRNYAAIRGCVMVFDADMQQR